MMIVLQGLLSTHGKELSMLEDAVIAVEEIEDMDVRIVPSADGVPPVRVAEGRGSGESESCEDLIADLEDRKALQLTLALPPDAIRGCGGGGAAFARRACGRCARRSHRPPGSAGGASSCCTTAPAAPALPSTGAKRRPRRIAQPRAAPRAKQTNKRHSLAALARQRCPQRQPCEWRVPAPGVRAAVGSFARAWKTAPCRSRARRAASARTAPAPRTRIAPRTATAPGRSTRTAARACARRRRRRRRS